MNLIDYIKNNKTNNIYLLLPLYINTKDFINSMKKYLKNKTISDSFYETNNKNLIFTGHFPPISNIDVIYMKFLENEKSNLKFHNLESKILISNLILNSNEKHLIISFPENIDFLYNSIKKLINFVKIIDNNSDFDELNENSTGIYIYSIGYLKKDLKNIKNYHTFINNYNQIDTMNIMKLYKDYNYTNSIPTLNVNYYDDNNYDYKYFTNFESFKKISKFVKLKNDELVLS
jgi:hypothetical protein